MKKRILTYLLALLAVLTMAVPAWAEQTEDDLFIYDTVGLLDALPSLTDKKERLNVIPGLVANPSDLPTGCSFNPRCQHCTQQCKQAVPEMVQVDDDHFVACHKYSKEG